MLSCFIWGTQCITSITGRILDHLLMLLFFNAHYEKKKRTLTYTKVFHVIEQSPFVICITRCFTQCLWQSQICPFLVLFYLLYQETYHAVLSPTTYSSVLIALKRSLDQKHLCMFERKDTPYVVSWTTLLSLSICYFNSESANFWKFTSYCSLKPLWSGMGEVVPARTSPTLHPPSPPTVHQLSWLAL